MEANLVGSCALPKKRVSKDLKSTGSRISAKSRRKSAGRISQLIKSRSQPPRH